MADAIVSWAAEVEEEDEKQAPVAKVEKLEKVEEKLDLPDIPTLFDPEEYDPPEPIIIKKSENTYMKISWKVDVDPKAAADEEYPDMVIIQSIENFRTQTQTVNKRIAKRRHWAKYGQSEFDGDGPTANTTNMVHDDIPVTFLNKKHMAAKAAEVDTPILTQEEEEDIKKMRQQILTQLNSHNLTGSRIGQGLPSLVQAGADGAKGAGSFSSLVRSRVATDSGRPARDDRPERPGRPGGRPGGDRMDDEGCGVRVTNLSENITDGDINDLFGQCGRIKRVYLARDKRSGRAKGFAYVTYENKRDAEKAIRMLNKYTYDYLVLSVEWSKSDKDKA